MIIRLLNEEESGAGEGNEEMTEAALEERKIKIGVIIRTQGSGEGPPVPRKLGIRCPPPLLFARPTAFGASLKCY